ncbi:MAG: metal-dependent hydrolase [Nanoarchaeota archaeon]
MMLRTHLAINLLAILLFFNQVSHKFSFVLVVLVATIIPDIDSGFSNIGKFYGSRVIQFFSKHRGVFHSFTFCISVSLVFAFFVPIIALPFFLGYSLHLFEDSLTIQGIRPFWPYKKSLSGDLRTGSLTETSIFVSFALIDFIVFLILIKSVFKMFIIFLHASI